MTGPSVGPKKFGYIKTNLDRTKPFLTTPTLTFHYIILLFDPYQNFFRSVQNHNHLGSTEGQGTNQVIKYVNIDIYSYLSTYRKFLCHSHTKNTTYTRNNMSQKCEGNCGLWVLNEIIKKIYPENLKKMWELFGSYLLNSTANPAHFHSNWAGSALLFSR